MIAKADYQLWLNIDCDNHINYHDEILIIDRHLCTNKSREQSFIKRQRFLHTILLQSPSDLICKDHALQAQN